MLALECYETDVRVASARTQWARRPKRPNASDEQCLHIREPRSVWLVSQAIVDGSTAEGRLRKSCTSSCGCREESLENRDH